MDLFFSVCMKKMAVICCSWIQPIDILSRGVEFFFCFTFTNRKSRFSLDVLCAAMFYVFMELLVCTVTSFSANHRF